MDLFVAIVAGPPTILLSDEPTICMVTHDPRYAHRASRTIHVFNGRVVDGLVEDA